MNPKTIKNNKTKIQNVKLTYLLKLFDRFKMEVFVRFFNQAYLDVRTQISRVFFNVLSL